jgi:hypothetical protein
MLPLMSQAEVNERMLKRWGDKEIARFQFRVGLFRRRGVRGQLATVWADRLALRDFERDDRYLCLECEHLRPETKCRSQLPATRFMLMRCEGFSFSLPTHS